MQQDYPFPNKFVPLPAPALAIAVALIAVVPLVAYFGIAARTAMFGSHPAFSTLEPFFEHVAIARSLGTATLGLMLLLWRRPAAIAVVLTAVWLGGPPIDYLLMATRLIALGAGPDFNHHIPISMIGPSVLLPASASLALLGPTRCRNAFGLHTGRLPVVVTGILVLMAIGPIIVSSLSWR